MSDVKVKAALLNGRLSIQDARQVLIEGGHSAKQANQLTLEMLRVKGEDLVWRRFDEGTAWTE